MQLLQEHFKLPSKRIMKVIGNDYEGNSNFLVEVAK